MTGNCDELEARINKIWGTSIFDWTVGRAGKDPYWFWYAGQSRYPEVVRGWMHGGEAKTLLGALEGLLEASDPGHSCERCEQQNKNVRLWEENLRGIVK